MVPPNKIPRHLPGEVLLKQFRVVRTVFGGLGEVVVCDDLRRTGRQVALKTFPANLDLSGQSELVKEAENWLKLGAWDEAFFVGLEGIHLIAGRPYLQMPYFRSGSLADLMSLGRPNEARSIDLVTSVLIGLWQVDHAGLLHRDIKPANVLIHDDGRALVSDFGLARVGRPSTTEVGGRVAQTGPAGTLPFMAPELFGRSPVATTQSDIWAFGVLAYFVLSGAYPFEGSSPDSLIDRILHASPKPFNPAPRLAESKPLSQFIGRLLEKDLSRRPTSWQDVAASWEKVVAIPSTRSTSPPHDGPVVIREHIWDTWHQSVFAERFKRGLDAEGLVITGVAGKRLTALAKAIGLLKLDKPREALAELLGATGGIGESGTIGCFLRTGTVSKMTVKGSFGDYLSDLMPVEAAQDMVHVTLKSYVSMLEDEIATDDERRTAMLVAEDVDGSRWADAWSRLYSAQIFGLVRERSRVSSIAVPLLKIPEVRGSAANVLFLDSVLADEKDQATRIALELSDGLTGTKGELYLCAHMWGVLGRWELASHFAGLAIAERADDLMSRKILVGALWNGGKVEPAREAQRELEKLAPEWPGTIQLAKVVWKR
ncbi:MAG: eukaryotic-like serine/threonine-protein kinase [Azoarcus sp.]|nr:eukaryotic-like serine/threonine-protein kinase [Azoarcus sp.]